MLWTYQWISTQSCMIHKVRLSDPNKRLEGFALLMQSHGTLTRYSSCSSFRYRCTHSFTCGYHAVSASVRGDASGLRASMCRPRSSPWRVRGRGCSTLW